MQMKLLIIIIAFTISAEGALASGKILKQREIFKTQSQADSVKSILISTVQQVLSDSNVTLTPVSEKAVMNFINNGINRLKNDGFTNEHIRLAVNNIKIFAKALIKNQELKGITMGQTTITGSTVDESFSLCPLYPFCQ